MSIKNFSGNVDANYLKEMAKLLEDIKNTSYQMMNLSSGNIVLDVGCGPGFDAYNLSKIVGREGKVIGLDNDPKMIKDAQENFIARNLEFTIGDVTKLPFPDGYFDSVRADKLFQVLPPDFDFDDIIQEMIRVTKKGGMIILVDTDWGSASLDYKNQGLTNRLLDFFAKVCRPNGYAGREFIGLLKRNNVQVVDVHAKPIITRDFRETTFGEWLTREALKHGIATPEEMERWNHDLMEKTEQGEFYSCVNMVLVAGKK
jgi:ubiquinone/menaquinone biosynthesis C-methylase UbiE